MTELFKLVGTMAIEGVDKAEREIQDITSTAKNSESKLSATFKKIGTAVAAAFAIDKIIDFGKEIVNVAATVAAEESAFAQIMGDYADKATEKLAKIADETGMVDSRLTPYMTSMTAKFKGLGYGVNEATDFAVQGLTLAADASAFWDMSLDESVSHLNSFINGSYEGGEAIGLFANDTQMATYAVEQGLISDAKAWASLDEATKQATRLEYAQKMMKLSGATGQAAKEADQYANVQANLTEKWRQFKAQIGAPLLEKVVIPAMQKLCDVVDALSSGYEKAAKWVSENQDVIVDWTGYILAAGVAVGTFLTYLNWGSIMSAAAKALGLVTAAVKTLTTTMKKNPIGLIISLVGALITWLVYLYNTNEEFREKVDQTLSYLWEKIKVVYAWFEANILPMAKKYAAMLKTYLLPVLEAFLEWWTNSFLPALEVVLAWLAEHVPPVLSAIAGWFRDVLFPALKEIFAWIQENVIPVLSAIIGWISQNVIPVVSTVFSWLSDTIGGFFAWFIGLFQSTGETTGGIWETIKGFFLSAWEFIKGVWVACQPFFQGIWDGIILPVWGLVQEIWGAFQYAWDCIVLIWDYVQPYFAGIWEGIKTVFSIVGEWFELIFKNAWEIIKFIWNAVGPYFAALWETIKAVFSVVATYLGGFFRTAWEVIKAIWNVVVSYFTMVWAGIKAVFAVVKGVLSGDFSDAWEAIKNVWNKVKGFFGAIWEGIKSVFGAVTSWFGDTFSAAWEAIKDVFSAWAGFFSGLWDSITETFSAIGSNIAEAIGSAVKTGINGVISFIEGTINSAVRLINGAIDLINLIPGVSVGYVDEVTLPRLAKGGVVTGPTIAEIGEDGAEAVVPLERNTGWIDRVAERFAELSGGMGGALSSSDAIEKLEELLEINRELLLAYRAGQTIKLNEREVARTVREYA